MIENINFIFIFLASAILCFFSVRLVIIIARHFNILDYPRTDRKIHSQPTPLLGGAAIYFAWLAMIVILQLNGRLLDSRLDWTMITWFLLAGLILIVNGVLDDKLALPAKISLWGPILASVAMIIGGLRISYVTNPGGGVLYLDQWLNQILPFAIVDNFALISIAITFLWLMSMTYTTKLLDGIDGLSSSIGLVAALVIFIVSLSWDVAGSTTSLLAISLAGAIAGFLVWNWHPAKIFLGEGGSTFIGFALGALAIISGSKIATALLVMGLPILDIFWVIIRRLRKGQPIWQGDKEHLHFRLLDAGLSQRQVVLFLSGVSFLFGLVAVFFTTKAKISALAFLLLLMFLLSIYLRYKLKSNDASQRN